MLASIRQDGDGPMVCFDSLTSPGHCKSTTAIKPFLSTREAKITDRDHDQTT